MNLKKLFIFFISVYQKCFSILKPPSCRFYPTCSQYSIDAIEKHGSIRGIVKAVFRLLRCHPFHPGGFDPVK
ncbi:MAG: membrane protein insertion efficiency factor YidD [Nitrospirae bacterium]|nr:membrane protein insertion efficiency factor YidD [Nitrospirota bacterium]